MKPHRVLLAALAGVLAAGLATAAPSGLPDSVGGVSLDSLLSKQLGLSSDQSKGGIGAILGLAKEKLGSADYTKLASMIPGADKYLSKAKSLGLFGKPIGNAQGLDGAFSKLKIPQDKASKMVPTVTDLVGTVGGDQAKSMLQSVLK